jgi:transcriptional coactivator p15 (PC4)
LTAPLHRLSKVFATTEDQMLPDVFELKVLINHEKTPVVSYVTMWNGKRLFHVRKLYRDDGAWKPGKGLTVLYDQKSALVTALCAAENTKMPWST